MLEFIILGMLTDEELTGYDVKKRIEDGIGVFYKASFGSLYPALKRLTDRGLLTTCEKPQGNRRKVLYHITKEGEKRFHEWLCAPADLMEGANAQLAKIYFFDKLPADLREKQLWEYEMNHTKYLQKLRELEKGFVGMEQEECFYYKLSTLYYGISVTQQTILWCRHIRARKPLPDFIESGVAAG